MTTTAASTTNSAIRIYGNGMTAFTREVKIGGKATLEEAIPVKQDQVWSLLGTLDFFGRGVLLSKPPAFSQTDTDSKLNISATDTFRSILTSFSGAQITISLRSGESASGTLIGVDSEQRISNGTTETRYYVTLLETAGARRYELNADVQSFSFPNEADQAKLTAALKRNYQAKIEPGNTLVSFSLENTTDQETTGTYEYALPGSPWASSYRLKRSGGKWSGGKWSLECYAVVHNKTQFDWTNSRITCVTGEPNYFPTTIAEAIEVDLGSPVDVVPRRSRGAVEIAEAYEDSGLESAVAGRGLAKSRGARALAAPMAAAAASFAANFAPTGGGFESLSDASTEGMVQAQMAEATASQVGDFLLLECQEPQTIPARSSALVRMYSRALGTGDSVLYYRPQSDPKFPFRSVRFTNDTGLPLAKGVATVVIDGVNSGESILEAAKPGDTRLLAHTLESGVPITKTNKEPSYTLTRIKIGDGTSIKYNRSTCETAYTIRNKMDEPFTLIIEHQQVIPESEWTIKKGSQTITTTDRISGGFRTTIELGARESTTLSVVETRIYEQHVGLSGGELINITSQDGFTTNEAIQAAIKAQQNYDTISQELQGYRNALNARQADFNRANQALQNATGEDQAAWAKDRRAAETQIRDINDNKIPDAERRQRDAQTSLYQAFKAISVDWTPRGQPVSTTDNGSRSGFETATVR